MSNALHAASPEKNVTVMASAGTGKTWLLVTRLLRLLLSDASPASILAITFTKKAAAEMQSRLRQRLAELASQPPAEIKRSLAEIGIEPTEDAVKRAQELFESILRSPWQVKTTTFHAFCQDLLRRFPMEAEIPPGFELIEKTGELYQSSWDALFNEAAMNPEGELAQALEYLLDNCGSLYTAREVLLQFLSLRSDWWAYSQTNSTPLPSAIEKIKEQLALNSSKPNDIDSYRDELFEFSTLLAKHPTKTNLAHALQIEKTFTDSLQGQAQLDAICEVFFTKSFSPRSRKNSKVQAQKMGHDGEERMLQLHNEMFQRLRLILQDQAANDLFRLNKAWLLAGQTLLDHYQQIKNERRLLDFSDLEWQAYQLLTHSNNAHWVQYKLDQRIDHLLVDEFQDTNPTQWYLLLPLLEELAASEQNEKSRSVFLVGDIKQSIYRFRRADSRLFIGADKYLQENLNAQQFQLSTSWRSSPAVLNCVNRCFSADPELANQIAQFSPHNTHQTSLWGEVTLLPLLAHQEESVDADWPELRNPLHHPRPQASVSPYYYEGVQIAEQINELINGRCLLGPSDKAKQISYSDIMILVRSRTHVQDYEMALRDHAIPFIGADKGTLLASQEIQDMVALLETLAAPHNNLSLASVLRSPIFSCSEDDLMALAKCEIKNSSWMERLHTVSSEQNQPQLKRAYEHLFRWHKLLDRLPVHDLLDRIYCEGNIIERFCSAFPKHLSARVSANLVRFIELALEIDSGRYPSMMQFLGKLKEFRTYEEAPDEAPEMSASSKVRIITIHASKGLESPVIFLADCASSSSNRGGFFPVINWPEGAQQPDSFMLGYSAYPFLPDAIEAFRDDENQREQQEKANLLYVALTRAKQLLYISGVQTKKSKELGWYGNICTAYGISPLTNIEPETLEKSGTPPTAALTAEDIPEKTIIIDKRLSKPINITSEYYEIAPSYQTTGAHHLAGDEDGTIRGIIIHRLLEELCQSSQNSSDELAHQNIASQFGIKPDEALYNACWQEAQSVFQSPELASVFQPTGNNVITHDELAIAYRDQGKTIHGYIDRLIVHENEVWVIDYKSHQSVTLATMNIYAAPYQQQLALYAAGVRRLWPDKTIRGYLLFTHCKGLIELEL